MFTIFDLIYNAKESNAADLLEIFDVPEFGSTEYLVKCGNQFRKMSPNYYMIFMLRKNITVRTIFNAIADKNLNELRDFLNNGEDVNAVYELYKIKENKITSFETTALYYAAEMSCDKSIINELVGFGAQMNTALNCLMCLAAHHKTAEALFSNKFKCDCPRNNILTRALKKRNVELIDLCVTRMGLAVQVDDHFINAVPHLPITLTEKCIASIPAASRVFHRHKIANKAVEHLLRFYDCDISHDIDMLDH